jgi:hypothetical protein
MRMAAIRSPTGAKLSQLRAGGWIGPLITAGVGAGITEGVTGSGVGVGDRSWATPALGRRSVAVAPSRSSTCENVLSTIGRSDASGSDAVGLGPDPGTVVGVGAGTGVTVRGGDGDAVSDGDGEGSSDGVGVGSGLGDGVSDGEGDGFTVSLAYAESAPPTTASTVIVTAAISCFFTSVPDRHPVRGRPLDRHLSRPGRS